MYQERKRKEVQERNNHVRVTKQDSCPFALPTKVRLIYGLFNTMSPKPGMRKKFLERIDFSKQWNYFTTREIADMLELDKYQFFRLNEFRKKYLRDLPRESQRMGDVVAQVRAVRSHS